VVLFPEEIFSGSRSRIQYTAGFISRNALDLAFPIAIDRIHSVMSSIVPKEKLPVSGSRALDEASHRISIEYHNTRISINESIEQSSAEGKLPDYHVIPLEDFYTRYQTSADGLAAEDAASRLGKIGYITYIYLIMVLQRRTVQMSFRHLLKTLD
jgi:hypothetical protein